MKILVTGASGLIGSALVPSLKAEGHEALRLVRSTPQQADEVRWHPEKGIDDLSSLEGLDAVVHLAGENVAGGRWTEERKARIRDSRVKGTQVLCESLGQLKRPPQTFASASAIGFYGNRGAEILTEESAPGSGFLAEVCKEWEAMAQLAESRGTRVVNLRFGVVLSEAGGALAQMLTPFKMGVGGKIGSGEQYMSWIALEDAVAVIKRALSGDTLHGPINVVAPQPVTNSEFTKTLGRVLSRPTIFPVPAFVLRLLFGEMADEALLTSERVLPAKLKESGFVFKYPELEGALRHILKK